MSGKGGARPPVAAATLHHAVRRDDRGDGGVVGARRLHFVLLIPFLRTLFGSAALPAQAGRKSRPWLNKIAGPFLQAGTPDVRAAQRRHRAARGAAAEEPHPVPVRAWQRVGFRSVVRDLRIRLFQHLQTLPLGYFQRTRGGQIIARINQRHRSGEDGGQRALASLLQELVVILVYVVILFGLSVRLALLSLLLAPVLLLIIGDDQSPAARLARAGRRARRSHSHVGDDDRVGQLIRRTLAEAFELAASASWPSATASACCARSAIPAHQPVSEVFGGVMLVLILVVGTRLALRHGRDARPAVLISSSP